MKERSLADRLDRLGGQLVADYGSYLLYEVPESTAEETIGLPEVETLDEYRFVLLNSGPVDTRRAASGGGRQIRESFDGKRLQIVQLVGPTRPEWLAALRDTGAEVVTYLPHNAYLVYADAASMGALAELQREERFVGWQAPYQREHKVHPRAIRSRQLRGLRKRTLQPSSVQEQDLYAVQLIDDPAANAVTVRMVRAISKGALRSQFRIRNYLNLIVPLDPGDVDAVAARPDVVSIHPFVPPERSGERQGQILASGLSGTNPGYLDFLAAMGFTQQQFTSSGFSVDISDSGIDNATTSPNHPGLYIGGNPAAASRVVYNRLEGSPLFGNTLEGCDGHGNINAHILAGYNDGSGFPFADAEGFRFGLGVAPFVRVGSSVIFAPDYTFPSFPDLQSRAYADGARISSNSWGGLVYGAYDVTAQAFDALVRDAQPSASAVASPGNQEMVIVIAAGNEGLEGLRSPGTSKNVISVGASENVHFLGDLDGCGVDDIASDHADDIAWFSSHGPTEDGRNKPDLVAPGTHVSGGVYQAADPGETGQAHPCFDGSANCGLATGFYFPPGQQFYTISSGTSHSTPAVAGSAALVRQLFINQGLTPPSPAMTKAFLMSSARYLTGEGANDSLWSNGQGMGAVDLGVAFDTTPRILRDQRPDDTFTASGETVVVTGTVAEPGNPFRVTLAWTDAPGSTTGPAFNNDLDLTVTVGGQIYKGNVFSGPFSITGGAADMRNNVESVFLPAGTVGDFTVSVAAININSDGVPNVGGPLDQDFALVVYNADEVPRPAIVPAGATLTAEACGVGNGALDPGEMVTVDLPLRNVGLLDTNQLVATLEASGGVTSPSGPQNYGQLQVGAPPVSRSFSFVAEGVCGGEVIATLSLDDGGVAIGPVQFVFDLGLQVPSGLETTLSNTASIGIPIGGPADPYPSTIEVSGLTGRVGNVTVTLSGVSHPFPDDIDVLLVAPDGRSVVLMSDAGGGFALQNANITFDDGAAAAIPDGSAIVTGTYRPANYEGQSDEFLAPAPSGPYGSALADLSGADPNGTWRLYIIDDFFLDGGILSAGWSLTFDRNVPVCCGGIPGFQVSPGEITTTEAGGTATFTLALSSMPSAEVSIGLASSDPTEGLVSPVELVFDPNDAQLPKIVTVTGVDDTLIDGDVTFTIVTSPAVTSDSDYAGLDPPDISVVNLNDDFTSMTIGDVGLVEGNTGTTSFVFPVTLTAPSEAEVSVGYATQDDTATAGSDYQAISGTLIFPPGTLVRMIPVSVTGDTAFEGDERFFVDLTGAVGADILDGRGVGTILNDDAPTLSVSATSVALGGSVQVTLSDGPGNRTDWVALAKVGSPLTSYSDWQYLNGTHSVPTTGLTSAVLTFNMPRTLGDYEFRFFANNGYTLLATSPAVSLRPPTLTSSAASVGPGGSVQVSVAEGPGYRGDWVALSAVGSPTTSYLDWKYLNGTRSMPATGVTSATLTFVMPQPLGNYVFRFFANNGNTLLATSPVVTVELPSTPILEVVPASLSFGTVATNSSAEQVVTVRNIGAGTLVGQASVTGAGFSLVGSSSYSLGAGESAPLTVRFAPLVEGAAIGTLSLTGAGGATVPLDGTGEQPSTTPVLEVDPSSLSFGSVGLGASADLPITVRNAGAGVLTGNASVTGSGFLLVGVSSYSLGPGEATSVTVRFTPMSAGDATGTLSLTGGNGATVPLSGSGTQGPSVAVSTTSVALGAPVQVTVSEGPGNRTDWVALAKVGSPLTSYSDWQYLSGTRSVPATGLTSAVLTFVMPRTLGDYEFRFFANNSYTLLAASPVVSLRPPTLTLSTTSVEPGGSVQVSVAEGPGYRGDWVSLSLVGSASTSYVDWKYLSGTRSMPATGVTSAVLTFVMPQTPGTYEFRFFANNGYTLLAKSPAVVVSVGTD